jgi:hypothetical protein
MNNVNKGNTNFRDFATKTIQGKAKVHFQHSLFELLAEMGTITLDEPSSENGNMQSN